VRIKRSEFEALLEASYAAMSQPPTGVWDGDVPAPVAPARTALQLGRSGAPGDAIATRTGTAANKPPILQRS